MVFREQALELFRKLSLEIFSESWALIALFILNLLVEDMHLSQKQYHKNIHFRPSNDQN